MFYSFGEVLFDCFDDVRVMGGAAFNVAAHLASLGSQVTLISAVGNDRSGEEIINEITKRGIGSSFVKKIDNADTGKVMVTVDQQGLASYEILFPVAWDFIDFEKSYEQDSYLIFGTLALRNGESRAALMRNFEKFSKRVFDINLRPPYYSKELIDRLVKNVHVLKLNEDELNILCEYYQLSREEVVSELFNSECLEIMLITKGAEGAELLSKDGERLHKKPGYVEIVDTVGCGDAFLAGFLHHYYTNKDSLEESLARAINLSEKVAAQRGAVPFC